MTFMANHLATKEDTKSLQKTFNQFDENGDGLIQREEFINGYKRLKKFKDLDEATIVEMANKLFD